MKCSSKSKKDLNPNDFRIRLPKDYPWQVLGYLAADLSHTLNDSDNLRVRDVLRSRDTERLRLLSEDWGLQSMSLGGSSIAEMRTRYQLAGLLKKFRFDVDRKARINAAKTKFLAGEEKCKAYNREGYLSLVAHPESWVNNAFSYARSFMEKLLGLDIPNLDVMTERSRHGPGASLDTKSGFVGSYFKFDQWPYQCTEAARRYARNVIYNDKRWLGALEDDYRNLFQIPKWKILSRQCFWDTVLETVDSDRIAFVPKDARTERTIAIGPTMNLYLQLGVDGFIRSRLKRWGVDLDHQEKNQELARRGSLDFQIDPFVTIDLANASNSISLKICELLCPADWYDLLHDLRVPNGQLGEDKIRYSMMSSMGNGFTFALESAIFTAIIYGVMMETSGGFDRTACAVYGDDLIVRKSLVKRLITMLTLCGFEINEAKSFIDGSVRESCGCDWFKGIPVRPVFLVETPSNVSELFSDINRLKRILELRWGIRGEESKTVKMMSRWIPEKARDYVGPYSDEAFDSYVHRADPGPRVGGMYEYVQLVQKSKRVKAKSFHMRKLMHDLHPVQPIPQKWEEKLTGTGSRFSVTQKYQHTLGETCSRSGNWSEKYAEFWPGRTEVFRKTYH